MAATPSTSLANAKQHLLLLLLLLLVILATALAAAHGQVSSAGGAVLELRRKVGLHGGGGGDQYLTDLRVYDLRRHGIDVTLGGNPASDKTGLYFTELEIGTPANVYHLQVDTGTGGMSINCFICDTCPNENGYGMKLNLYNPSASQSASYVLCGDTFCAATNSGSAYGCATPTSPCQYTSTPTAGFFVRDLVHHNQVSGNGQSVAATTVITFGCGSKLAQDSPDHALDGVLGFGQSDSSIVSQLAATGQARKMFAHCLDSANGGGIFAIGNVVQPNIVKRTALVLNTSNYNVNLNSIDVGGTTLSLPLDTFTGNGKGTIIDSGTALVYLPEIVYKAVAIAVFAGHTDTLLYNFKKFMCFQYSGRVDNVFPQITFHFEGDLELKVYPHDYLLSNGSDWYCVGIRNGVSLQDRKDMVILGDLALSNKVVVYDLETQVIGWTEYDCSLSIKVEDEVTKSIYDVKAHHIPSEAGVRCQISLLALFVFGLLSW